MIGYSLRRWTMPSDLQMVPTGPTILEMALASRPDVVLLDIGLPGLDGDEAAK